MSISIREIAKIAGVSRGTVDRALNDRPGIKPEIKHRILQIARDHGYRSNRAGLMLGLRKKPLCFGIQMPSEGNPFFDDVIKGIQTAADELADFGLRIHLMTMKGFSVEKQLSQIRALIDEGIQGLIFVPIDHPDIAALLQELDNKQIPVITFNNDIEKGNHLTYIGNDYIASGRTAAGILGMIADGRTFNTLILTGSIQVLGHNQRINGFNQVIRQYYPHIHITDILECQDDDKLAYQQVKEALQQQPDLQALYLTAGGTAGACTAIADMGLAGKVKIVSFDLTEKTKTFLQQGAITATIEQQPFEQGYRPVKVMFDYLLDGSRPPSRLLTHNTILIREHMQQTESAQALSGALNLSAAGYIQ